MFIFLLVQKNNYPIITLFKQDIDLHFIIKQKFVILNITFRLFDEEIISNFHFIKMAIFHNTY